TQGALTNNNRSGILSSHLDDIAKLDTDYDSDQYDSLMYGDCIYNNSLSIARNECESAGFVNVEKFTWNYPQLINANSYTTEAGEEGEPEPISGANCQELKKDMPSFLYGDNNPGDKYIGLLDPNFIDHITIQAEHAAVIWN